MVILLADRLIRTSAPAIAAAVEGGSGAQKSSHSSTWNVTSTDPIDRNRRSTPNGAWRPATPICRPSVILVECRVGVDVWMIALAQDQLGVRNLQVLAQLGSRCRLHAMIRPKDLRTIGRCDGVVRLSARMRGGK